MGRGLPRLDLATGFVDVPSSAGSLTHRTPVHLRIPGCGIQSSFRPSTHVVVPILNHPYSPLHVGAELVANSKPVEN